MKLPDIEFKYRNDPGLLEWSDHVRIILNLGRYQFRIVGGVPDWSADEGEAVIYVSGNDRRFYFYMDGAWYYIGFDSTTGSVLTDAIWDADHDTGVQTEESTDENILRFDTGGTEAMVIDASQDVEVMAGAFAVPSGEKIHLKGLTGNTYTKYNSTTEYQEIWVDGQKRIDC